MASLLHVLSGWQAASTREGEGLFAVQGGQVQRMVASVQRIEALGMMLCAVRAAHRLVQGTSEPAGTSAPEAISRARSGDGGGSPGVGG